MFNKNLIFNKLYFIRKNISANICLNTILSHDTNFAIEIFTWRCLIFYYSS
jgi:hypothetical protein